MSKVGDHKKHIRVPVRFDADGQIEYFYGGAVPKIAPGTIGDLVIPEASLTDPADVRRLDRGHQVELLPAGASVLFAVDGNDAPAELAKHLKDGTQLPSAGKPHAVEVQLREPAVLHLRASKPATLEGVTCWIPSLKVEVESLNHAYRLVSEKFEPNRMSHTGDVFRLGYCPLGKTWRRLDNLRREREAPYEMPLSQIGSEVLEALPSRVGAVLRTSWIGRLESPGSLRDALHQYRLKLRRLREASELADIETGYRLIDASQAMLDSISVRTSEEHHRLIQAAVKYLVREEDEESDTQSLVGFNDDALVVQTISEMIERDES
jgi:hypothetical protein